MAVDTTIDNAVIDFASISNLLQTLKTHDDLFMKFASGSLGSYSPVGSKDSIPVSASTFQVVGVKVKATMTAKQQKTVTVPFGKTFSVTPTVVATVSAKTNGPALVAQLQEEPSLDSCLITVTDANNQYGSEFIINVIAFGPTANV